MNTPVEMWKCEAGHVMKNRAGSLKDTCMDCDLESIIQGDDQEQVESAGLKIDAALLKLESVDSSSAEGKTS